MSRPRYDDGPDPDRPIRVRLWRLVCWLAPSLVAMQTLPEEWAWACFVAGGVGEEEQVAKFEAR
jgi:hypothetical protein